MNELREKIKQCVNPRVRVVILKIGLLLILLLRKYRMNELSEKFTEYTLVVT